MQDPEACCGLTRSAMERDSTLYREPRYQQGLQHSYGSPMVGSPEEETLHRPTAHPQEQRPLQHPTGDPQRQGALQHPTDDTHNQEALQPFVPDLQESGPLQHPTGYPQESGPLQHPMGDPEKSCGTVKLQLSQPGMLPAAIPHPGRKGLNMPGLQREPLCLSCRDSVSMEQEDPQGDVLQKKLSALHLDEPMKKRPGFSFYKEREVHSLFKNHDVRLHFTDIRYPEPLATEESPRRRSRSLPWNTIPEVDIEDEEDSIMCCCKLKKKVQFADSLGLTLASVKHFLPSDDPLVPQAVLARLQSYPPTVYSQRADLILEDELTGSNLAEPMSAPAELIERLNEHGVCLEQVSGSSLGVRGYVLVKDPRQAAQVKIRYTFNEWLSFLDCPATLVGQSATLLPPSGCQRFHFNLCYPPSTSCIHFAICFSTEHGQEIWDNNKGANYTVTCHQDPIPEIQPSSPEQEEWEGSRLW